MITKNDIIIKSMETWKIDWSERDDFSQEFTLLQIWFVKKLLNMYYPQSISREAVEKLREKRRIRKVKKSEQYLMIELFQDFCVLLDNHGTDE